MKRESTKQVVQSVVTAYECDACGKVVPVAEFTVSGRAVEPEGWAEISRGHSDWGNDSVESWDRFDVCSGGCYLTIVRREFEEYATYNVPRPTLSLDGRDFKFWATFFDPSTQGYESNKEDA